MFLLEPSLKTNISRDTYGAGKAKEQVAHTEEQLEDEAEDQGRQGGGLYCLMSSANLTTDHAGTIYRFQNVNHFELCNYLMQSTNKLSRPVVFGEERTGQNANYCMKRSWGQIWQRAGKLLATIFCTGQDFSQLLIRT